MADHRITDFVDQSAIDGLARLKAEMAAVKEVYIYVANELLKGLKMPIDGLDQLNNFSRQVAELQTKAAEATKRHVAAIEEQNRISARTTATIAEQLQEQTKLNHETRQSVVDNDKVKSILEKVNGTYDNRLKRMIGVEAEMKKNATALKDLEKGYQKGTISADAYKDAVYNITKRQRELAAEKQKMNTMLKNEEREMLSVQGTYNHQSQQLELLKKAYKDLTEEERNSTFGKEMLEVINQLDTELKHQAERMGENQRNVGNYAIACQNGVVVTEDLNRVLAMQPATIEGCIAQNKALQEAKERLSLTDADYEKQLENINKKLEENNNRILDVDAILKKQVTTAEEAEEQNKLLAAAMKRVDQSSAEGKARIAEMNAKYQENKKVIKEVTDAMKDQEKENLSLVDQLGGLIGVNTKFGNSLHSLAGAAKGGNVIEGLTTKIKAFGSTLMGLLANPWVLAILGIGGVVAGFKWWYDYNKGLVEATRLTKSFTGKTGQDLKNMRDEISVVADKWDKDFKSVLNATDKMASQLGISYEEALSAIKDGFLVGADAQGEFLQNIDKFAPALRDAGVSAKEMVAIMNQTKSGVFSEDGLKAIQVASDRIKRMPKSTQDALQALGMSTAEIQKSLEDGSKSMMDIIKEVSAKLQEFPQNSEAYGNAIFNVFGRKAAAGGTLLIESLAEIDTNLDGMKTKLGEVAELNEKQMNTQIELRETINAVFDKTGGTFETMTARAKLFVTEGLLKIIRGCVDIVNWFIRMYNQSAVVRGGFNAMINSFKTLWEVCKMVVGYIVDSFKGLGEMIEGVFTLDTDKIASGWKKAMTALQKNMKTMTQNIIKNTSEAIQKTISDEMKEITINIKAETTNEDTTPRCKKCGIPLVNGRCPKCNPVSGGGGGSGGSSKSNSDAEKRAKEEIKRLNELEEAKLKLMEEGHEKELAQIRFNFNKKIREIMGNSDEEVAARKALIEAMEKELAECERKYQENLTTINLNNRLEIAKKGSREELAVKLELLDKEKDKDLEAAKKSGADMFLIEEKYQKKRKDLIEDFTSERVKKLQDDYAAVTAIEDNAFTSQINKLKVVYTEELRVAGNNEEKQTKAKEKYERNVTQLTEIYAIQRAQSSIDMTEELLKEENLSAEEREQFERDLAKAKMDLETAIADHAIAELERTTEEDKKASEKRIENAQKWLNVAADALNALNGLSSAVFDAKIQRIDEELEESKTAADEEQQHISELVEKKVITEEEGEARKRAAEAQSAKKTEELEKKKSEMKYKQAVWDKANSLIQASIATALAITQALPNVVLAAIAGAMGAIQIATIAAAPIPKYAKGTDHHEGGLAVVGDGGKSEIVSFGGQMYITPDKPTLIDMPKGAEVFPDASQMIATLDTTVTPLITPDAPRVVVNNDYTALQREVAEIGMLIKRGNKERKRLAYLADFERFKIMKGL